MDVIYKITSPKGKVYIGRTKNFNQRMIEHKHAALTKKLSNSIYKAIRRYGWDNMTKEIICEVDPDQAQVLEEELIKAHNSVRGGYNDTYSGGGGDRWEGKRDTVEFMEFVENQRKPRLGSGNGMFGKQHTPEAREKQKQKAKGRFSLPWFIERNGEEEGTRLYEERCKKLRERNMKRNTNGTFTK